MEEQSLSIQEIVEKDFKKSFRGYKEEEVDLFLDRIIEDYEFFNKEIEQLMRENDRLKRRMQQEQPRKEHMNQHMQVNYDILKRLSNLEKAVFGSKTTERTKDELS